MDIYTLNAIVLPLFATWFIPVAIRDPKSGKYKGFKNRAVGIQAILLLFFETQLLVSEFGVSFLTIARIMFCIGFTFCMALVFVSATQKKMFGNKFTMEIDNGSSE